MGFHGYAALANSVWETLLRRLAPKRKSGAKAIIGVKALGDILPGRQAKRPDDCLNHPAF
jgi:hypothetical protein